MKKECLKNYEHNLNDKQISFNSIFKKENKIKKEKTVFKLKLSNLKYLKNNKNNNNYLFKSSKKEISNNFLNSFNNSYSKLNKTKYKTNFIKNNKIINKINFKENKIKINIELETFLHKVQFNFNIDKISDHFTSLSKILNTSFNSKVCYFFITDPKYKLFYNYLFENKNSFLINNLEFLKFENILSNYFLDNEEIKILLLNTNFKKIKIDNKFITIPIVNEEKLCGFFYIKLSLEKNLKNQIIIIQNILNLIYKKIFYQIYLNYIEIKKNNFITSISDIILSEDIINFLNLLRYNVGEFSGFEDVNLIIYNEKMKDFLVPSPSKNYKKIKNNNNQYTISLNLGNSLTKKCYLKKNSLFISDLENSEININYDNQTPIDNIKNIFICSLVNNENKIVGVIQYVNKQINEFFENEKNNINIINNLIGNLITNFFKKMVQNDKMDIYKLNYEMMKSLIN